MPHPPRLPVRQLFRLLDEQLQTPQHAVATHLGLSRQAVNNWAAGMSLPLRYRDPFFTLVDRKLGEAVERAEALSHPTRTLLEMPHVDAVRLNLNTALLMWWDECLRDRGGLARIWRESLEVVNLYGKDEETIPNPTPADLEEAVKQLGRVIRTRNRLDLKSPMPLVQRWGQAVGDIDPREVLWRLYARLTGTDENEARSRTL
jgi:hypothetical protein